MLPARDQARAQDAPARAEGGGAHRPRRKDDVAELHPLLPVRDGPRPGLLGHRCRRQPLPRLHSGDCGRHDRPLASEGRCRDQGAGRQIPAHVGHRLLLQPRDRACRATREQDPSRRSRASLLHQLGGGGDRGRHEAGALRHRPAELHRIHRRLPRPHFRCPLADRVQGEPAPPLRAPPLVGLPCAVPDGGARRHDRPIAGAHRRALQHGRAGRKRGGRVRRAHTGRRWLPGAARRLPAAAARADPQARHPARRRRGAVRHGPDGSPARRRALGRQPRHHLPRQGHRLGPAAGCVRRPRRADGLAAGIARKYVRRQSARVRGGAGDPRPARERLDGERGARWGRAARRLARDRGDPQGRERRARDRPDARPRDEDA